MDPVREFFLLRALGQDLPGALEVRSHTSRVPPEDLHGNREGGPREEEEPPLRFSLAGVQLKFSAVQQASGGLTIPARGIGGDWIVKLPSTVFPAVPENEFSMLALARASGIVVPETRLVDLEEIQGLPPGISELTGSALAIRRFDRDEDGVAIHQEDFAQVFGVYPEQKYRRAGYRNLLGVLWAEDGEEGVSELIRRLVFDTLIGNADGHLKNHSLVYPDRRHPRLAPAYDLVSTRAVEAIDSHLRRLPLVRATPEGGSAS